MKRPKSQAEINNEMECPDMSQFNKPGPEHTQCVKCDPFKYSPAPHCCPEENSCPKHEELDRKVRLSAINMQKYLIEHGRDLPPEIAKIINEKFWELI